MKKQTWIILGVVAVIAMWAISSYNGMVKADEKVNKAWGDVETSYQRRYDLIPTLVEVVKGYATHERETLNEVIEARNKATQMTVNIDSLDEESMKKFQEAQSQLQGSLSRLMAISESYPDLKANENFLDLQSQLEGTENRISEARKNYNKEVEPYNVKVRRFPTSLLSGIFGFETRPMFKADEGASQRVEVKF